MSLEEFDRLVQKVVIELPKEFKGKLDNVVVVTELWPTPDELKHVGAHSNTTLYGLYQGVPQTKRQNYSFTLPDKIIIFAGPILSYAPTLEAAKIQIRKTVLHEIGHHFGMSEFQIQKAQGDL